MAYLSAPVTVGNSLTVEHVLYHPMVTANAKTQTVRMSHTSKPLGLVVITVFDPAGNPVGNVQVSTADLRAALAVSNARP